MASSETSGRNTTARTTTERRTPLQIAAGVVGVVFLLVGILGFIPGITQNLGDIEFIGHESDAELLGIFRVNVLHNIVHLLFGVLGLWAATSHALSRTFLVGGGVIYLVLWIYGLAIDLDTAANFVSLNTADNWLHFALGAGMVALGVTLGDRRTVEADLRT